MLQCQDIIAQRAGNLSLTQPGHFRPGLGNWGWNQSGAEGLKRGYDPVGVPPATLCAKHRGACPNAPKLLSMGFLYCSCITPDPGPWGSLTTGAAVGASLVLARGWVRRSLGTQVGSPGDPRLGRVTGGAGQGQPITFASGKPLAQVVPRSLAGSRGCWPRAVSPACCCLPAAGRGRSWLSLAAAGTPLTGTVPPQEGSDTPILAFPHPAPSLGGSVR